LDLGIVWQGWMRV